MQHVIELPYPPTVNTYWRHWNGRTLISRKGREFREHVCALLCAYGSKRLNGDLSVKVDLYPPDKRRRDIDNSMKALLDAMQHGGVYEDDGQIVELWIKKMPVFKGGKAVVSLEEVA